MISAPTIRRFRVGLALAVVALSCLPPGAALAQVQADLRADSADDLTQQIAALDLDDLLDMKVTLATRTPEPWFESANAMYVISNEDIRRSGILYVPELLRMAPGVHVARLDANKWKIAIRGFNERFSNKLLVLIDGRIVYSPLFSGVYWDVQNLAVEDIDRIEIVRGPGAALWGSNAVNGIINILTRNAADTQGGLLSATGGVGATASQLYGRYGFGGEKFQMRIYGKWDEHDAHLFPADGIPDLGSSYVPGEEASDGWEQWQVGFNADWQVGEQDRLTFFGNYNDGEFGQTRVTGLPRIAVPDTVLAEGLYSGLIWRHDISPTSDLILHVFQDHAERGDAGLWERRDTWTFDFQHSFGLRLGTQHELVWGGEYRTTKDETRQRSTIFFDPADRRLDRTSFFVQDRIPLTKAGKWMLTVGSKFEDNTITGFEYQPSMRLAWLPSAATTGWAAVSRAVRTPSRADSDLYLDFGMPIPVGNPDLESERVVSYELGVRHSVSRRVYFDLAGYYNDYARLIVGSANDGTAKLAGTEFAARLQATESWNLAGTYTWTSVEEQSHPNSPLYPPRHMFGLRSYLDLPAQLEGDVSLYHVARYSKDIPENTRLDLRLGWVPADGFEMSLGLLNLLDEGHLEARGGTRLATDVPRSVHLTARLRM